ncbi:hypothetical protein [Nostoc linckia]|nr:hypothetical protein [Nostoc linckia]
MNSREIEELRNKFKSFTALYFISGQKRMNRDILAQYLQNQMNSEIYICGSSKLKESMKADLKDLGVSKEQLHEEDFADGYVSFFQYVKT